MLTRSNALPPGRTRGRPGGVFGRRDRAGAVIAELAFVLVFLLTITLGMFELSRGMMVKQTLTAAARKGARTGILHLYGNTDIANDATNIMRDAGFDSSAFNPPTTGYITITVTDPSGHTLTDALDAPSGSTVSVQVGIPVSSFAWVSTLYLQASMVESDTVVMMKQ
jgi:Flp pilus assembly protein TadG